MQTLHIHDISDELYNRLRTLAQSEQRSLNAQVILLLEQVLEVETQHQK